MQMRRCLPIVVVFCGLQIGCATNSKTRWLLIGAAAPVGAISGAAFAPENERKDAHAGYGAAVAVTTAAIIGNLFFNDDKELKALRERPPSESKDPVLKFLEEGSGNISADGKRSGKGSAKWKRFGVDIWEKESPLRLRHVNEIIEIENDGTKGK